MVATTGSEVLLVAVKDEIFPVPLAGSPILVTLFVQLNTVPGISPAKVTVEVLIPLHNS
jgi:hypothetical protein